MKHYILITPSIQDNKFSINEKYTGMLRAAGGFPIIADYGGDISDYIEIISGIVLSGGGDIAPEFLYEPLNPLAADIHPQRDSFEVKAVSAAVRLGIPLLGICRGAQIINAALGGRTEQHIDGHIQQLSREKTSHKVYIKKDSRLYDILGCTSIEVNSFHHQAVKAAAKGIKASAFSPDGIIEAVEGDMLLGVQWHPEALNDIHSQKIFRAFISAIK